MTLLVRESPTSLKSMVDCRMRNVSAALVDVGSIWMRSATAALKLVWTRFAATLDTYEAEGIVSSYHITGVKTGPVSVVVTGGVAPLTYVWERTDINPEDWTIIGQGTATAQFKTVLGPGDNASATFVCKVSDASGVTIESAPVTAACTNGGIA